MVDPRPKCEVAFFQPLATHPEPVKQVAQPKGAHLPRDLWEYRAEKPTMASIYLSGALCMPRLTTLYLWFMDAEDTLGRLADSEAMLAHRALGPFVLVGRKVRRRFPTAALLQAVSHIQRPVCLWRARACPQHW